MERQTYFIKGAEVGFISEEDTQDYVFFYQSFADQNVEF